MRFTVYSARMAGVEVPDQILQRAVRGNELSSRESSYQYSRGLRTLPVENNMLSFEALAIRCILCIRDEVSA